ncbi:hypothetical protein V5F59_17920 [Xanthobacter autotrophicus DSM 431]|uniref:hypothetical protein n=1 Tax=Xanthobacter nonsaccharivorans TaxID=3119912 RepID=UPI003728F9E4
MRQNIVSAILQTSASLGIAALSIAIFHFLTPDQTAFVRQHYFVPFAIFTALAPANQNYLRSILFSSATPELAHRQIASLALVQLVTSGLLVALIVVALETSGTSVSPLNLAAFVAALLLVLLRTLVTGVLEFRGNYTASITLNNMGVALPYVAVFLAFVAFSGSGLFAWISALNIANAVLVTVIGLGLSGAAIRAMQWSQWRLLFSFRRYASLSLISVGSVIVYQGVEFALYNYTEYDHADIASYALAFSASAVIRQVIVTAIQPLEHEHNYNGKLGLRWFGNVPRPIAIEFILYTGLILAVLVLPPLFTHAFPSYEGAGKFVAPLMLGVLGSAIQQIYSVRMIAQGRTGFLSGSQLVLAFSCLTATIFLNPYFSLTAIIWLTSILTWLRGCIIIPLYIELSTGRPRPGLWIARGVLSCAILSFAF